MSRRLGECYESAVHGAFEIAGESNGSGLYIVHGIIRPRGGPLAGIEFDHAWIEIVPFGMAVDFSVSKKLVCDRRDYYRLAGIGDERGKVLRYSLGDAIEIMRIMRTYGPWDLGLSEASFRFAAELRDRIDHADPRRRAAERLARQCAVSYSRSRRVAVRFPFTIDPAPRTMEPKAVREMMEIRLENGDL